jgi:FkbM family methyltransferase
LYGYWSKKYKVEKVSNNLFKFTADSFEFLGSLELARSTFGLIDKYGYSIKQKGRDLFTVNKDKVTLTGSSVMIHFIKELTEGIYKCDCTSKTVLDIGGFEGETAAYFYSLGAKKVIVYEPIPANFKRIEQNMLQNSFNAELHNEGIGAVNGTTKIAFCNEESMCSIKSTVQVLTESQADVAKIDAEGAEETLCDIPNDILRSISYYMIEVHSNRIRERLLRKFADAGFGLVADFKMVNEIDVIHMKRQT